MTLDEIDKTGLIRESYLIDGIHASECRSIFLDWAIKLPADTTPQDAVQRMLDHYGADTSGSSDDGRAARRAGRWRTRGPPRRAQGKARAKRLTRRGHCATSSRG